mgnify:CR=1 FL=1
MGKFKKIFNYYLSSYWNNSRTLSSMYSFLKIFFERNNKIDSTVSSFGNVFRNSKWSNMQTQNIKKLFIKQWLGFFLLIISITLLTLTYSGVSFSASYLCLFHLKQTLNELITNCYYLVGCIIYQVYMSISSWLISNQRGTTPQTKQTPNLVNTPRNIQINTTLTSSANVSTNLFFLQQTLLPLSNLNSTCNALTLTNPNNNLNVNSDFLGKVNFLSTLPNNSQIFNSSNMLNTETPHTLSSSLNCNFSSSLAFSTNLESLYIKEGSFRNDPMLTETLTHNLNNTAKQQRWLTRNFWSNQNFISDSNKLTEAKNFIQNPLLSHSSIDSNIWLSNKLSGLESEKTTNLFNKLSPNYNLLSVFNFFDTSRFFLNQRYNFLNQLPNQFIISSPNLSSYRNLNSTNETTNLKLTLLQSYFLRNIIFNTSLYSSNYGYTPVPNIENSNFTAPNTSSVRNLFISTTFTNLLQQSDLHTLNTVNASTNASNKLHLNSNCVPNNFKS